MKLTTRASRRATLWSCSQRLKLGKEGKRYYSGNNVSFSIRHYGTETNDKGESVGRIVKKPSDSFLSRVIPIGTDQNQKDNFINSWGSVRLGLILEFLDGFAGSISYIHSEDFNRDPVSSPSSLNYSAEKALEAKKAYDDKKLTIVTAAVDSIKLLSPFKINYDLFCSGRVTHVGKSSMEVKVQVSSIKSPENYEKNLEAYFVLVARDKKTGKAATVPSLKLETDEDLSLWKEGEARSESRKQVKDMSLYVKPPTRSESELLHQLFLQSQQAKITRDYVVIPVHKTQKEKVHWTHPQNKNIHGKLFGGWLIRQGFELAFITCSTFSHVMPKFLCMGDIHFLNPVQIGGVLSLDSKIVYTEGEPGQEGRRVMVRVNAKVEDFEKPGSQVTTNVFWILFDCQGSRYTVEPHSYADAMLYLEGRRKVMQWMEKEVIKTNSMKDEKV